MLVLLHGFGANERDLLPMAAQLDPPWRWRAFARHPRNRGGSYWWVNRNTADELDKARRMVTHRSGCRLNESVIEAHLPGRN